MIGGVRIQHELRERPMQTSDRPLQHDKARTGEFGRGFKIHAIEAGADIDVILDLKIKHGNLAPAFDLDVVVFISTDGDIIARQVGQCRRKVADGLKQFGETGFGRFQFITELADFGHDGAGVLALTLEHTDLLGQTVALRLQILRALLQGFTLGFQRIKGSEIDRVATGGETAGNVFGLGTQQLDIKHVGLTLVIGPIVRGCGLRGRDPPAGTRMAPATLPENNARRPHKRRPHRGHADSPHRGRALS